MVGLPASGQINLRVYGKTLRELRDLFGVPGSYQNYRP